MTTEPAAAQPAKTEPAAFAAAVRRAAADPHLRGGLLAFQRSWRESRGERIAQLERATGRPFDDLRGEFAAVKDGVRDRWPELLAQFRARAEQAGAIVVEAETAEEAAAYIAGICRQRGIDLVVKSKSMVSEEIELNERLERRGVRAIETDLGEWLLQLARERPSHLVMPAIHQRRGQIARVLGEELDREFDPDDIPAMVASARGGLRRHYLAAGAGLTGANALVAETGSVLIVTNEGNMRLASSLPPVHFVTAGIEKLVPDWASAARQIRLLPRSATAQSISSYTTAITGAQPGREMHIILLDNGRRQMAADEQIAPALRCIRCGACANVCPPYAVVGGHAFGHIYTGAIGLVNTPYHHSPEDAAGPQGLCVSCGACETACPVAIPLPAQILHLRRDAATAGRTPRWQRWALKAWASPRLFNAAVRVAAIASRPLARDGHLRLPLPKRHAWRKLPAIPLRNGRQRIANLPRPTNPAKTPPAPDRETAPSSAATAGAETETVTLFAQCLADRFLPETVESSARLLNAAGLDVHAPPDQHCCGLPAFDAGHWDLARKMARHTIEILERRPERDIVTPAASCVAAVRHHWPDLFENDPKWRKRAADVAARFHDLADYLEPRLPDNACTAGDSQPWTSHRFCQATNTLKTGDAAERLVQRLTNTNPEPLQEADVCCGFGGLTSITSPEVGQAILQRKLDCITAAQAQTVLTQNPGCILHLNAANAPAQHYADYLAARLPDTSASKP